MATRPTALRMSSVAKAPPLSYSSNDTFDIHNAVLPLFVVLQEKILASVGPKYFKATFLPAAADRAVVAL